MTQTLPGLLLKPDRFADNDIILREKRQDAYHPINWGELRGEVRKRAKGLLALGVEPGDRVAIMAPNSPQWTYADLGILSVGAISVPVYQTEGINTLLHILQDSSSRLLILQAPMVAAELMQRLDEVPQLEKIILLDQEPAAGRALSLPQWILQGESMPDNEIESRLSQRQGSDVASLVYTSGTTGTPKGVMLTHDNFLSNVKACLEFFDIRAEDECLSFLPLSHVFERTCGYYLMLHQGATISYAESIDRVPVNFGEVRPTVAISVPRLYEKMYARVQEQVLGGPPIKRRLFNLAILIGQKHTAYLLQNRTPPSWLKLALKAAQVVVFKKLHQRLGGRLRFFVSGGAPLGQNLAEFFLSAGIPIYEGYGLTETAPVISANHPGHLRLGTIGQVIPGTEVKIAEDGEILARGPGIFKGYWNNPEATAEVLQEDGWFHTGDIGVLENGYLAITDRKKELIVTAGGKNIPPQNIENRLKTDRFIANVLVFGDNKPYLVGLIVPHFPALTQYANFKKIEYLNDCDLVQHPRILDLIRRRVDKAQVDQASYLQVKRFTLLSRDFLQEEGELTPTMKIRRKPVQQRFANQLEGMYLAKDHGIHDHGFCIVDRKEAGS